MEKTCTRCGLTKTYDCFGKSSRSSTGLASSCKKCDAERAAEYRAKNPEKAKEVMNRSREKNRDSINLKKRERRKLNPEKFKQERAESYARHRDKELAKGREYKLQNKERIAKQASEKLKQDPYLNRFYRSERRAIEKKARPLWCDREAVKALHFQAAELASVTGFEWHVDHIVPLKSKLVCGLHWHGNMQLLPASVNQSKSNRLWPDMP